MSNREKCIAILDSLNESQMVNATIILQAMKQTIDDMEDEAFCEKMVQEYEADPDKGDPMPLEEFAEQLGIKL